LFPKTETSKGVGVHYLGGFFWGGCIVLDGGFTLPTPCQHFKIAVPSCISLISSPPRMTPVFKAVCYFRKTHDCPPPSIPPQGAKGNEQLIHLATPPLERLHPLRRPNSRPRTKKKKSTRAATNKDAYDVSRWAALPPRVVVCVIDGIFRTRQNIAHTRWGKFRDFGTGVDLSFISRFENPPLLMLSKYNEILNSWILRPVRQYPVQPSVPAGTCPS